ncbi:MAG: LamG-like jellyroll fold domain-containing protein [Planctomycetota bacterium]
MKRQRTYRTTVVWFGVVISGFLGMASVCPAVEYTWTQMADMPTPRWNLATGVVDGKIYAMGGEPSEPYEIPGDLLSIVEEYDPATDTWTRKADMPTETVPIDATVVDGKIYVIGGDGIGRRVIMYDPASDTWTQKADMPTPRFAHATCAVDGKIYAIGGSALWDYIGERTVEEYDPVTDTWARKADMPFGVWGLRAIVVNGKIYALGGRPGLTAIARVQEYDPATDTWTLKTNMPVATSQMGAVVLGDKVIVVGGWLSSMALPYSAIQMYDPETDTWSIKGDAPFLRAGLSAEVVNNRVYAIGGTDRQHPCPATSTVYAYDIITDFNGDGKVDGAEICSMVDRWGTDDPLCDIGPRPWGDGVVDMQDLVVLADYIGQDVDDMSLIAHWALDETEGDIAYDSAGDNEGTLVGDPVWSPEDGMVKGAVGFDGVDDHVATDYVLNPADGPRRVRAWVMGHESPFSVLAWVKGGAPGQVLISQVDGENWLCTDPTNGCLMTELKGTGRHSSALCSDMIVTDGSWHRIALVYDGDDRSLYVDDTLAAQDAQAGGPADCYGGLNIGCGADMTPGTFFTGLIDDVRIYNRAVRP